MSLKGIAAFPFYPVLVAGVMIFAAYLDSDVSIHAAIRPFLLVVTAATIAVAVATRLIGPVRGPLVTTVLVVAVRSGDTVHAALAVLLVILVTGTWLFASRIFPQRRRLPSPNRLFNGFSLLLVAATVATASVTGTLGRVDLQQGRPFGTASLTTAGHPGRPDIYVILLDGYPRADTLHRLFQFDNRPFVSDLANRGFEVADQSRSNYMYTAMSLTSILHMRYVQDIRGTVGVGTPYGASLRALINDNPVWDDLRSRGYLIAANQAPWETVAMRHADLFCGDQINDFELYLLRTTLAGSVVDTLNPQFSGDQHRSVVNQAFDCLSEMSAPTNSPKLVFIHVGAPHLPIVFTRSGGPADIRMFGHTAQELPVSHDEFASAYTGEIQYLNGRILEAVDLLAKRRDAPIVVLMSDHGSESHLDWADSSQSDLQERFSNFFAAKTPAKPSAFPADITLINLFPILFNAYLGEAIPLHDSRFYLSPTDSKLDFTEIPDPAPPAATERFDEQSGPA